MGGQPVTGKPTTAAGRTLVAAYADPIAGRSVVVDTVLRCEAEARAAALADVTAAVEGLPPIYHGNRVLDKVLAAIKELENR